MKVTGNATLNAAREEVWKALNDPAVLCRTIPGCERLETIGENSYRMTITAGVASIKGVYQGEVSLTDQAPLDTFVLRAAGSGAPGTVSANVLVTLAEDGAAATKLTYDADAIVGGMLGGVGQRMLSGVAKKTAGEFFGAVDDVLNGRAPAAPAAAPGTAAAGVDDQAQSGVYVAPPRPKTAPPDFAVGVVVGALASLAGALVGGLLARRRR